MKKNLIIIFLTLVLVIPALISCGSDQPIETQTESTEEVQETKCLHVFTDPIESEKTVGACLFVTETSKRCINCNFIDVNEGPITYRHTVDYEKGSCVCGNVLAIETELGKKKNEFEIVREEMEEATERCDYDKVQECMNKIIALQNGNYTSCKVINIIGVYSVSHCTTTYNVNSEKWSAAEIALNAFGSDFRYKDIQCGNIQYAIKKASGLTDAELKNTLITIAANYETNGYEFYISIELPFKADNPTTDSVVENQPVDKAE